MSQHLGVDFTHIRADEDGYKWRVVLQLAPATSYWYLAVPVDQTDAPAAPHVVQLPTLISTL